MAAHFDLTPHAESNLRSRRIPRVLVRAAVENPTFRKGGVGHAYGRSEHLYVLPTILCPANHANVALLVVVGREDENHNVTTAYWVDVTRPRWYDRIDCQQEQATIGVAVTAALAGLRNA